MLHVKFAKVLVEEKGYDTSLLEPFDKHRDLWYIFLYLLNIKQSNKIYFWSHRFKREVMFSVVFVLFTEGGPLSHDALD